MSRSTLIPAAALLLVVAAVFSTLARRMPAAELHEAAARSFEFSYQVHFPTLPDSAATAHLWIPLPQPDGYQEIQTLHIESPVHYRQDRDPQYGNAFAEFTPSVKQAASGFDVIVRFTAIRHEHLVVLDSIPRDGATGLSNPGLQRYLEPDRLVPLNGVIADLAREHTAGDTTTLEKARHIYDYVVATLRYDKSGEGWGRGDAVWACTSKRGNCTDFHSLLIGMMRSSGIPARFEIGFPLPADKSEGEIPGYHCWAEFYLPGAGWVPVDASEAWKNPSKRNYFFGAHDANRIFFTYGRDIVLSADQKSGPLNYFIYPYAEANGRPVNNLQAHFSFRDISSQHAAGR